MSHVTVRIPTPLRKFTGGQARLDAEGQTVGEALEFVVSEHEGLRATLFDDEGNLRRFVNVFVGDTHVGELGGLPAALPAEAELSIVPAVAGGRR